MMNPLTEIPDVPFIGLYDVIDKAFSSLQIEGMKTVPHEDTDENSDFSVDPLADPRLDKMDLFNMVDSKDRDVVMNASASYDVPLDQPDQPDQPQVSISESPSDSGAGE
ncbi:hypothetical protein [Microvirus mar46]|uniref:Uncharacterized protein n=1 Tax=Microvirus mar46 TaxID=2851181 RepID=A0A8F5MKQ8_9VIRU|nr:hypothetical protein [Microvirus mar46]